MGTEDRQALPRVPEPGGGQESRWASSSQHGKVPAGAYLYEIVYATPLADSKNNQQTSVMASFAR